MLDLDHFKSVNDTYGHVAGDKVLQQVSGILKAAGRLTDSVVRWGGEEFIILLPEIPIEKAEIVANKIRTNVQNLETVYEDKLIKFTVSIGLSYFSGDSIDFNSIINKVDKCLYKAKAKGRNIVCSDVY